MNIVLYCDDLSLISRWEKYIDTKVFILDDEYDLLDIKNSLVIYSSGFSNCDVIIDNLKTNNNKILILERIPDFNKAYNFLSKGVNGYGNVIMSKSYFISAIEAIKNDMVWLIPDITTLFIKNFINNDSKSQESQILKQLTSKENEIANLLKQGYTNTDITNKLDISVNTVKTHIKNIYKKLNVNDRVSFSKLFN